jgi:WD40 repeat protein
MKNIIFLYIFTLSYSFTQDQLTVINPIGHRGQIRDIAITNDKKFIVSASFDKTIKKWDIETGEVVQEFRVKIGKGNEGSVYFIELSPDNNYLAAGGWFGPDDESEDLGDIRIFDFKTGEIIQVLKGLGSSPHSLNFSEDSKFVIAGDIYSKIYKWNVETGQKVGVFDYHKFIDEETLLEHDLNQNILMSVDKKGMLCFWDINSPSKPIKVDKKTIPKLMNMGLNQFSDYAGDLAVSPTLEDFAFSIENYIVLMDKKYKSYFIIENKSKAGFLKFSADGKRLMTGCVSRGENQITYVFEKSKDNKSWTEIAQFQGADASVITGDFIDNQTFVCAGGSENYIYIWSLEKDETGKCKTLKTFKSNGLNLYAVSLNEGTVAYADVWTENFGKSTFNKEFDLFLKQIDTKITKNYTSPITERKDLSIKWCRTYAGLDGLTAGLEIKRGKQVLDTIKRDVFTGSRHTVYTITERDHIITGGDYGFLEAYNEKGQLLNRFVGHTDLIHGLSITEDGTKLISSSGDNSFKIWSLENVGKFNDNKIPVSMEEYLNSEYGKKYPIIKETIEKYVNQLKLSDDYKKKSIKSWENVIQGLKKVDDLKSLMEDVFEFVLDDYRVEFIYPIVSVFMTIDGEWIIWNEDGYFSASKKGAQYVGYYLNQGKDKAAKFYPFEQFDLKFNRPDIILKDLSLGSEKIQNFYYKAYLKRLDKMGINENSLSKELKIPSLIITKSELSADKKSIEISFDAKDELYRLDRINVFINDVPIYGRKGIKLNKENKISKTIALELADGKNKIQISVLNDKGIESLKENLNIFAPKSNEKPDLYIVSIGTSKYKDSRFNLKYAAKDAEDIVSRYKNDASYKNVYTHLLIDEKTTKENIESLKKFLEKSKRNDLVMVFIAGHGILDENLDYYYASYDIDFNAPALKGVLYSEIEELLDGISALKKLLFMDTCHSGEVDKDEIEKSKTEQNNIKVEENVQFRNVGTGIRKKQGVGSENTSELVKELFSDLRRGTGSTVISSAGGAEFAMESSEWKNGLFTFCFLEGIKSQRADLNSDGVIMLSEMQNYLQKEVFKLSAGKQKPNSRIENLSLDYPIWKK